MAARANTKKAGDLSCRICPESRRLHVLYYETTLTMAVSRSLRVVGDYKFAAAAAAYHPLTTTREQPRRKKAVDGGQDSGVRGGAIGTTTHHAPRKQGVEGRGAVGSNLGNKVP